VSAESLREPQARVDVAYAMSTQLKTVSVTNDPATTPAKSSPSIVTASIVRAAVVR